MCLIKSTLTCCKNIFRPNIVHAKYNLFTVYTLLHFKFYTALNDQVRWDQWWSLGVSGWPTWHTVTSVSPTSTGQWLAGAPIETGTDAAAIHSYNISIHNISENYTRTKANNSYTRLHLGYLAKVYNKSDQRSLSSLQTTSFKSIMYFHKPNG